MNPPDANTNFGHDIYWLTIITDFEALKSSGRFIIHKEDQGTHMDPKVVARREALRATGLKLGWYLYIMPNASGAAEAKFFLDSIGLQPDELVAIDWENTTPLSVVESAAQYIYDNTGQWPCIYCSPATGILDDVSPDSCLINCPLWFARYSGNWSKEPVIPKVYKAAGKKVTIWQYSGDGLGSEPHSCPGLQGNVLDSNVYMGDVPIDEFWKFPNVPPGSETEAAAETPTKDLPPSPEDTTDSKEATQ